MNHQNQKVELFFLMFFYFFQSWFLPGSIVLFDNLGFLFSTNSITTKLWQQQKAKTTLVFKFMFISPGPRFGGDLLFGFRGYDARANAERFFTYLISANDTSFYNLVEFKNPPAVNHVNCSEMYYTVHLRDVLLSSRI